jgi:type II secretory pathway component PulC
MKRILRNINLLNILLIGAILILINYTILPLFNMSVPLTLSSGKTTSVHKDEQPAEIDVPLLTDYAMIADDNLFHPERRIPVETVDEQSLPKPEFVLFGTLLTDDIRLAYLKDRKAPLNTGGRGDRQTAMKIGDTMSGYALKEIYPDKVIMARGDELVSVSVSDSVNRESPGAPSPQMASKPLPRQSPSTTKGMEKASRPQEPRYSTTEPGNLQKDGVNQYQDRNSRDSRRKMRTSINKGTRNR